MIAALCFDGIEDDAFLNIAMPWLPGFSRLEAWCAYGDSAERIVAETIERHHGPRPPPPAHHRSLDVEQAESIAAHAVDLLRRAGFSAEPRTLGGRDAGHALAEASHPEITLILLAGHRLGTGPKSVGHVARFVIDHALGPVLVLRLRQTPNK